jgi:hypothetical protein
MNIKLAIILFLIALLTLINCSDDIPKGNIAKTSERGTMQEENIFRIVIRWPGDDFATKQDIETRNNIERLILEKKIGKVIRVGTGMGWMDITVEVKDKQDVRSSINDIMRIAAPTRTFTIEEQADVLPGRP